MTDPNDPIHTNAITWSPTDNEPRALMDLQRNIQHRNVQQHIDDPTYERNLHPNNFEPYVHKELRSFSKDRYTKQIYTTSIIDSRDRNTVLYPFPNNFTINLGKQYEYVESITLTSVDIDNTTPPIHQYNNTLQWIYPRECDVISQNLIPGVATADIPSSFFASERTKYTASVPIGFYTVYELASQIIARTGDIIHSMDDSGAIDLIDINHNFDINVNVNTHQVSLVNRADIIEPIAIQTILPGGGGSGLGDVFAPFIVGPPCTPDVHAVFITIPGDGVSWASNMLPLVLTNMPSVGGIQAHQLNWTCFWSSSAWGGTGPISAGAPYYEQCDTIQIGTQQFTRFKMYPRTTRSGGSVNSPVLGSSVGAVSSQNIILSISVSPFLNGLVVNTTQFAGPFTRQLGEDDNGVPSGGISLPFGLITLPEALATDCNIDAMKAPRTLSVLSALGFEQTHAIVYAFIQTNQPISKKETGDSAPFKLIDWERNSVGDYIMNSERYILMRIVIPARPENESGGNTVKTASLNPMDSNNNIGFFKEPVQDFNSRSIDHLFAKIQFNAAQPNRSTDFQQSTLQCYGMPLARLNEITVQLVNRQGMLANIRNDWNFTLEIVELKDVLAETLIDTRNGSHVITGMREINHHY